MSNVKDLQTITEHLEDEIISSREWTADLLKEAAQYEGIQDIIYKLLMATKKARQERNDAVIEEECGNLLGELEVIAQDIALDKTKAA